jgi:lysophospholipase L1-like esterase
MKGLLLIIILLSTILFEPQSKPNVLVIGDSLSSYTGGWQDIISKKLNYNLTNVSKSGAKTDWMLGKLKYQLRCGSKYDIVYIYGGINDIFSNIEQNTTISNICEMIELCNRYDVKPYIIIGYNPYTVMESALPTEIISYRKIGYFKLQQRIKSEIKQEYIIPMNRNISKTDVSDGIHLNLGGHYKLANWILNHIK